MSTSERFRHLLKHNVGDLKNIYNLHISKLFSGVNIFCFVLNRLFSESLKSFETPRFSPLLTFTYFGGSDVLPLNSVFRFKNLLFLVFKDRIPSDGMLPDVSDVLDASILLNVIGVLDVSDVMRGVFE